MLDRALDRFVRHFAAQARVSVETSRQALRFVSAVCCAAYLGIALAVTLHGDPLTGLGVFIAAVFEGVIFTRLDVSRNGD